MSLIQTLITTILPVLLQIAEAALGVKPDPTDASWVAALLKEIVGLVQKFIPSWLLPPVQELEALIAAEIEKLLGKV
jgi:hypothetical protein